MANNELLLQWVAVPAGKNAEGKYVVSAVLLPRSPETPEEAGALETAFSNWANDILACPNFSVRFHQGSTVFATTGKYERSRICPAAWRKVFFENEELSKGKLTSPRVNVRLAKARTPVPRRSYAVKSILNIHAQMYAHAFVLSAVRAAKQTSLACSASQMVPEVEALTTALGVHQSELQRQNLLNKYNFYNFKTVGAEPTIRMSSTLHPNDERDYYRLAEDPETELMMDAMATAKFGTPSKRIVNLNLDFLEMAFLTRRVTLRNGRTVHRAGPGEVYAGYLADPKLSPKLGDEYLQWKRDGSAPTLRRLALSSGEPSWVAVADLTGTGHLAPANGSRHDWAWSPAVPGPAPALANQIDYYHANTHDQIVYKYIRDQSAWKVHETFDTLQKIQLLRNYPYLLRTLGLVIDLKFDLPPGDLSGVDRISVLPTGANGFGFVPTMLEPRSWMQEFYAADEGVTWVNKGLYKTDCYSLETLDWEAFSHKLINSMRTQNKNLGSMLLTDEMGVISYACDYTGVFGNLYDAVLAMYHRSTTLDPQLGVIFDAAFDPAETDRLKNLLIELRADPNWQKRELPEFKLRGGQYNCGVHIRFYIYAVRQEDGTLKGIIWQAKAYLPVFPAGQEDPSVKWKPLAGEPPPPNNVMPMPTSATRGISIVHNNRLERTAAASAQLAASAYAKSAGAHPALPPFNAQSLAMGFVVDAGMKDPSGCFRWLPLCVRQEDYSQLIPSECNIPAVIVTEGMLRSAGIQATDQVLSRVDSKEQAKDEFLPESIATWKGGSMCAPSDLPQHSMEKNALPSAAPDWKLDVPIFEARRGSACVSANGLSTHNYAGVPPLRFSKKSSEYNNQPCNNSDPALCTLHDIHVRIRAVDLAGNALPVDKFTPSSAVKGMNYCRHEVIPAPVAVFKECPSPARFPGRSQSDLVIYDCGGCDERYLAPPRGTLDSAELHGCFDACVNGRLDARDLSAYGEFSELCLDSSGAIATVPMPEMPGRAKSSGAPKEPASVPVYQPYHRPQRERPRYYPDPKACVIYYKFTDFRGKFVGDGCIDWYPNGRRWPRAKLVKVALKPGKKNACAPVVRYSELGRELIVELPPAWSGDLELSCGTGTSQSAIDAVSAMGLWSVFQTGLQMISSQYVARVPKLVKNLVSTAAQLAAGGALPLFSPPLKIRCTHAVAAPLVPVTLRSLENKNRAAGQTNAELRAKLELDLKSMGRVTVSASWDDINDSKPDGPVTEHQNIEVYHEKFQPPASPCSTGVTCDITQEFNDHKHRVVTYSFQTETRHRDQYPGNDPLFGKGSVLQRTELFKSTSAPDRPTIDYIVPTFGWSSETETCPDRKQKRFRLERKGGGLRVYMKRGWYSSGPGEMFAVVLSDITAEQAAALNSCRPVTIEPKKFASVTQDIAHLLTQWGMDPVVKSTPINSLPTPANFKGGCIRSNLRLRKSAAPPENPGAKADDETTPVAIAAYPVAYDQARNAWYADVVVDDVPSYNCFIRMAIARYQPHSNAFVELSEAVLANYAQLSPDRAVIVMRDPSDRHDKSIIVQLCAKPTMRRLDRTNPIIAEIYRRAKCEHGEMWVIDEELKVQTVEAGGDVLWCGKAVWPDHRGDRCLVLREFEEHAGKRVLNPDDNGIVFSAVLEI